MPQAASPVISTGKVQLASKFKFLPFSRMYAIAARHRNDSAVYQVHTEARVESIEML